MINRPSHAQRTLELARRSLELVPVHTASSERLTTHIPVTTGALADLIDLQTRRRATARLGTTADGRCTLAGR